MHQERRAPIHIRLQNAHAFLRIVPAFHHDEIQFIAQEFIHDRFVLIGNFDEIRQHTNRRVSALHRVCAQQLPNRVGRVAMFANQRLQ